MYKVRILRRIALFSFKLAEASFTGIVIGGIMLKDVPYVKMFIGGLIAILITAFGTGLTIAADMEESELERESKNEKGKE